VKGLTHVRMAGEQQGLPTGYRKNGFVTKSMLLNRPATRKTSGTKDTAFRGRREAKRVRVRKLQRQARRVQR
jgi:hypothetical protein